MLHSNAPPVKCSLWYWALLGSTIQEDRCIGRGHDFLLLVHHARTQKGSRFTR